MACDLCRWKHRTEDPNGPNGYLRILCKWRKQGEVGGNQERCESCKVIAKKCRVLGDKPNWSAPPHVLFPRGIEFEDAILIQEGKVQRKSKKMTVDHIPNSVSATSVDNLLAATDSLPGRLQGIFADINSLKDDLQSIMDHVAILRCEGEHTL